MLRKLGRLLTELDRHKNLKRRTYAHMLKNRRFFWRLLLSFALAKHIRGISQRGLFLFSSLVLIAPNLASAVTVTFPSWTLAQKIPFVGGTFQWLYGSRVDAAGNRADGTVSILSDDEPSVSGGSISFILPGVVTTPRTYFSFLAQDLVQLPTTPFTVTPSTIAVQITSTFGANLVCAASGPDLPTTPIAIHTNPQVLVVPLDTLIICSNTFSLPNAITIQSVSVTFGSDQQTLSDLLRTLGYVISADGSTILGPGGLHLVNDGSPLFSSLAYCLTCGKPVNAVNGTMWEKFADFTVTGRTPDTELKLERTYLSHPVLTDGDFGPHWFQSWETQVIPISSASNSNLAWIDTSGAAWIFRKNSDGSFSAPPGFFGSISETALAYLIRKPNGLTYSFSKDSSVAPLGRLTSIRERHGETISLFYNSTGDLTSVTTGLAGTISFTRNADRHVTDVVRQRDGLAYHFAYDSFKRLSASSDFEGNLTRYAYASNVSGSLSFGLLASITDPLGRVYSNVYDPTKGTVLSQREPGNGRRTFAYRTDSAGLPVTTVREIDGSTTTFHFDSKFLLSETDYQDGAVEFTNWSPQFQVASVKDPLGFTTLYGHDTNGNLTSRQKPLDTAPSQVNYDPNFSQPVSIQPLVGGRTTFQNDPTTGDILSFSRNSGAVSLSESVVRDLFGNPRAITNGLGTYANEFDANGLNILKFDARNPETRTYDSKGRIASRLYLSGRRLDYQWDNHDRATQVADSAGPTLRIAYDVLGRVVSKTWTDGHSEQTTAYVWDSQNRLVNETDALGNPTLYQYDLPLPDGSSAILPGPVSKTDANGNVTRYEYDIRARLVKTIDPLGAVTRFQYNDRGDRIGVIDPLGKTTSYTVDGNGRITKRARPSLVTNEAGQSISVMETSSYFYDLAGKLIREEKNSGTSRGKAVTEFTYDGFDRVVRKVLKHVDARGTATIEDDSNFQYANAIDIQLLTNAKNGVVILDFTYDTAPPYLPKTYSVHAATPGNPLGIIEGVYQISRGTMNEPETIVDSTGKYLFQATYDPAARLLAISSGNRIAPPNGNLSFNFEYDSFGRKTAVRSSTGEVKGVQYDVLNRIENLNWSESGFSGFFSRRSISEDLDYDANGNITLQKREFGNLAYQYDAINQLTSVDASASRASSPFVNRSFDQNFKYDLAGNRTLASIDGGQATYLNNQILKNGNSTFESDPDGFGNLSVIATSNGHSKRKMTYRADGRLTGFELTYGSDWDGDDDGDDAVVTRAEYFYDALGRRVVKRLTEKNWEFFQRGHGSRNRRLCSSTSQFTQSYSYLIDQDKIESARAADGTVTQYLDGKGIDEHLGKSSRREKMTYLTDHLGSVLNSPLAGLLRIYGPFGTSTSSGKVLSQFRRDEPVMYGFTGRQFDAENGLYYYRARTYNPDTGRFLQKDPIGFRGRDFNLYRYAADNPLIFVDPSGRVCGMSASNSFALGVLLIGGGYGGLIYGSSIAALQPLVGGIISAMGWVGIAGGTALTGAALIEYVDSKWETIQKTLFDSNSYDNGAYNSPSDSGNDGFFDGNSAYA
jgi:RHS repeat-associated protein